jgi:hypothetical protein
VRLALVGDAVWVMFLLRLSPLVPYVLLNYALALSGVRYRDFPARTVGMLPAIVMYVYYGKIVGDVAKIAAAWRRRAASSTGAGESGPRRHDRGDDDDHARGASRNRAAAARSMIQSTRS